MNTPKDQSKDFPALQKQLRSEFKRLHADPPLDELLDAALTKDVDAHIVYTHRIQYWKDVLDELQTIKSVTRSSDLVVDLLLTMNFNFRRFCFLCIDRISAELEAKQSSEEKIRSLIMEKKIINQLQFFKIGLAYDADAVSVKEFIGNWITEELAWLEKELMIERGFAGYQLPDMDLKLALDLSVAQLTCWVRSITETGIILDTNPTELAIFFSRVVTTKRSETMSEGSFRRKFYNIEDNTRLAVIEILNKQIDWLSKK